MVIALDPGVKAAGVAVFIDGELDFAWLAQGKSWQDTAYDAFQGLYRSKCRDPHQYTTKVVIERPQVYQQRKLKGDPNDLVSVALMAGAFCGYAGSSALRPEIVSVFPRYWKGQVDPDVMIERIKGKLSKEETGRVELPRKKNLQHNVWDAVGIGLWVESMKRQENEETEE
jgi:hypothetical protein